MAEIIRRVANELKNHAHFTLFGALTGIIIMLVLIFGNFLPQVSPVSKNIFYILHPTHVFLSALVTTTLYIKYGKRKIWLAILIGYTGSIGISFAPKVGFDLKVPILEIIFGINIFFSIIALVNRLFTSTSCFTGIFRCNFF